VIEFNFVKKIFLVCLFSIFILFILSLKFLLADRNYFIDSPLPTFLTLFKNKQVSTLDIWLPDFNSRVSEVVKIPEISARAYLTYDLTTNRVIYQKNSKEKLPMASLTKIMTAIVALENKKKDDKYFVTKADLVGEDSMGLSNGEVLSQKELLYGLMLRSGNDAAETLASNFSGGRTKFIEAMNNKAKSLGLKDTNFTNPTGLEGDGRQYTTAYDLLVITRYAILNFPLFDEVVSTFEYNIPWTKTHKAFYLANETNLLTSYSGVRGVKTGYTPEAGLCLVTYLDYKGHKIIGILLGSDNRRQEMEDLLDYSLKSLGVNPPQHR
jgi:D-alanyl-D-alanine carboxypeptidase (penicillin-binding protein 5/6)